MLKGSATVLFNIIEGKYARLKGTDAYFPNRHRPKNVNEACELCEKILKHQKSLTEEKLTSDEIDKIIEEGIRVVEKASSVLAEVETAKDFYN